MTYDEAYEKYAAVKHELTDSISEKIVCISYMHNNEETRHFVETLATDCFYEFIKKHNLPLYDNCIRCDDTNNTASDIDSNTLHLTLMFRLVPGPKRIELNYTGCTGSELCPQ